jgi:hypothetical protein
MNQQLNQSLLSLLLITLIGVLCLVMLGFTILIRWIRKFGLPFIELFLKRYDKQHQTQYFNMSVRETIKKQVDELAYARLLSVSGPASDLMINPIQENFRDNLEWLNRNDIWKTSLVIVFDVLQDIADEKFGRRYQNSTFRPIESVDVLTAFQIKWCNIPPICKPIYE